MSSNFYGENFCAVYIEKHGLFNNKKLTISLTFYDDHISGSTLKSSTISDFTHQKLDLKYSDIKDYYIQDFENNKAIIIETCVRLHNKNYIDKYFFPFEPTYNINDIFTCLEKYVKMYNDKQEQIKIIQEEKIKIQQEKEEQERAVALELKNFFNSTYNFHINENTPVYTMDKSDLSCFALYIGEGKSINFLYIDATSKSEIHSVIPYDEIHYYEKAGAVHYATNINAKYTGSQSFGGSFVGGKVSASAATLGGLLFGPMGMAVGAMLSYKPAEYTPPTHIPSSFDISSELTKIDERSVILNYYSEQHKQYMDIELPQDVYNFMQTYLPDKKYAIVIEKEKQSAVAGSQPTIAATNNEDTSIQRLTKLKQLYEMELITEEEYLEKKSAILSEI